MIFFYLSFLSSGYLFQLHTGHTDHNCLIETVLGSGYLFQLHTGNADQNCLIETVQVLKVIVFNCFHDNLHKSAWIFLL